MVLTLIIQMESPMMARRELMALTGRPKLKANQFLSLKNSQIKLKMVLAIKIRLKICGNKIFFSLLST